MLAVLQREFVYLWYYFDLQLRQIFPFWLLGMLLGSAIAVFAKESIHNAVRGLTERRLGVLGIIPASLLGIASPLCMYGTIPLAASFAAYGVPEYWLAAFMMSSVLLNPQLILYSMALGSQALAVRLLSCFLCGITAGLLLYFLRRPVKFFNFTGFQEQACHDTDPNLLLRFLKNLGRNLKATGPMFLLGVILSALFQRYVPAELVAGFFGNNQGFGVLMAATIGVPLYACGGGTIPLLQAWLADGMSLGSAAAFMITGPATKITNMGAVKIVLGLKNFVLYLLFVMLFALLTGLLTNLFIV